MNSGTSLVFLKRPGISLSFIVLFVFLMGCVADKTHLSTEKNSMSQKQQLKSVITPPVQFGTVAVTKINIEHPTAKLVYKENGASDIIVRHLKKTGQFRVIDWTNLEEVLLRRNMAWSDLTSSNELAKEISDVLLNDYFLMGTVTAYGERMDFSSSAFSKSKVQTVNTTIELTIKDAITNEIVASAMGSGSMSKQISQTLGFGAAGGNDTVLAGQVLDEAIEDGINRLLPVLTHLQQPRQSIEQEKAGILQTLPTGVFPQHLKVLFLFSEEEETSIGDLKPKTMGTIDLSIAENAMAKEFLEAGCQVFTAGDVVNKAYTVEGGENLLLGGWVSEQDLLELENLLQARSGLAAYAVEVGKAAGADIVVSGTVRFQTSESSLPKAMHAKTSSSFLFIKAIQVSNARTLHISEVQQDFMAIQTPNQLKAKVHAIKIAARKAAKQLISVLSQSNIHTSPGKI